VTETRNDAFWANVSTRAHAGAADAVKHNSKPSTTIQQRSLMTEAIRRQPNPRSQRLPVTTPRADARAQPEILSKDDHM